MRWRSKKDLVEVFGETESLLTKKLHFHVWLLMVYYVYEVKISLTKSPHTLRMDSINMKAKQVEFHKKFRHLPPTKDIKSMYFKISKTVSTFYCCICILGQ